ncbi:hypothetical protein JB92DRAFT_2723771 [Gautieria morchelliformis]|nr:hypothetical protein JB92DRAFT_2723771 [Gautieria morchelliformis]
MEIHQKMGHISQKSLQHLLNRGMILGIELSSKGDKVVCDVCIQAKIARKSLPQEPRSRSSKFGDRIYSDVWGPARHLSGFTRFLPQVSISFHKFLFPSMSFCHFLSHVTFCHMSHSITCHFPSHSVTFYKFPSPLLCKPCQRYKTVARVVAFPQLDL